MILQAAARGADVFWLPVLVLILGATRAGRAVVERTAPWTVSGLEPQPVERRCTCHASKRCAYCLLEEWRAERQESSCSSD